MELKRLQKFKGVKMVKKYRDRQGQLRVVALLKKLKLESKTTCHIMD